MRTEALVLVSAAALLRVPSRRIRALALGEEGALRDWLANESALRLAEARRDARLAAERIEACGARLVSLADRDYPGGLKRLKDPPPFLIVRGAWPRSPQADGIAIVGSREADPEASAFARALAARVAAPIVSGLAYGIDAAAHEGALAADKRTIAYVATGIGVTFPPEHAELEARIVAAGGAIASGAIAGGNRGRLGVVKRDRLQAARTLQRSFSCRVSLDGGAMHTMRFARDLDRPRFALTPRDGDAYAGNARALAEGARELPWDPDKAALLLRSLAPGR